MNSAIVVNLHTFSAKIDGRMFERHNYKNKYGITLSDNFVLHAVSKATLLEKAEKFIQYLTAAKVTMQYMCIFWT